MSEFSIANLRKQSTPFKLYNLMVILVLAYLVIQSWISTGMNFSALIKGWGDLVSYIKGDPTIVNSGFFPPSLGKESLVTYFWAMIETVEMAIVALFISLIIAVPLSYTASRNILEILIPGEKIYHRILRKIIYTFGQLVANIFRSINELVWALIFVSAVGLGPMAGILALAFHTTGVLSKLLSEGNESIDPGPVKALTNSGSGFIKVIVYGIMPQTMPHFISMTLYRFESDVRSATVLGFVGAGGIGYYLFDKIRSFENSEVCTILIFIVITVWILDYISAYIRKKFI
jgi:phosphonate transport system permease protein